MPTLCNRGPLYFCPVVSSFLLSISRFFLVQSQPSQIWCLPYFDTWCGPSANLECRSETCCTRLAGNAGRKKSPKIRHLGTIAQICRAISSQLRHVLTIGKKLLNSNIFPTCVYNMANLGLLAAEIRWRVWGTPANFSGFPVLAALLHGSIVVGVSQTLRRWTEGATYIRQSGHHVGHWRTFLVNQVIQLQPNGARFLRYGLNASTVIEECQRSTWSFFIS